MPRPATAPLLPLALVLAFGLLMAIIPALVKLAAAAAVPAALFALIQAAGAGVAILLLGVLQGRRPSLDRRHLRYYAIAGLSGIALPNELLYVAVPHLGAGLTSLTYCFPPMITLGMALVAGMERPCPWRVGGMLLGFGATLMIALPKGGIDANPWWLGVAMGAPLSLAFGNVYRSHDWPDGAHPLGLAAGMLLAGALWLVPLALVTTPASMVFGARAAVLLGVAVLLTAVGYVMFLELQRIAGPVYLSQVGYVITVAGLAIGVAVLGEHYSPWVWLAVAGVFVGVALTTVPQARAQRRPPA